MKPLLVAGMLLVLVRPALAQPGPSVDLGLHANITLLDLPGPEINGARPLSDIYGTGFGGGVHLDIGLPVLAIRFSGDYISFSPDNDRYREALARLTGNAASQFSLDGGQISIISASVNGKMPILPLPVVSPYLTGGIGLARLSVDATTVLFNGSPSSAFPSFSSETNTTVNLGAGVDVTLGITLFVEGKYTWIFTEGETSTYVPITLGVTF